MIDVTVLLFSVLKEKVGTGRLSLSLPAGTTIENLLDELCSRNPSVSQYRGVVRVAVNERYERGNVTLKNGDEVALITPVSGG